MASLGEVAEIVSGATPKTTNPEYWGGEIWWVTPADLSKLDGAYIGSTPRTITAAGLGSCAAQVLPPGSVLLSSRAPIGHVAINTEPMATNQGFKSLIPRSDSADGKYLYHWLRAHKEYLQSLGNGATFKEVSKAVVSKIEIPLPPLGEQRRIAAILDQSDLIITKRRRSLEQLALVSASLFSNMFGDPTFSDGRYPVVPLAELIQQDRPITYGILKPGPDTQGGIPYVRVADMKGGGIDLTEVRRTTQKIADEYKRSTLRSGDLLMSIRGHVGRFAFVPQELDGANITQDSARLAVRDSMSPVYVRAAMEMPGLQQWMVRHTKGVAVRGINLGDLKILPIPCPPLVEQEKFAAAMKIVDEQRYAAVAQLESMEECLAGLRSRAFSGEL